MNLFISFLILLLLLSSSLLTRDTETIPLKKGNVSISEIILPESAPTTQEELDNLNFPYPLECCDLDFKNLGKGKYLGPDGGKVSLWKKGNWQWERSDGFLAWEGGEMVTLKNQTHRILSWRKDYSYQWIKRSEIHFPDSSSLSRWWNQKWGKWMYLSEKNGKQVFLIKEGDYLPQQKKIGKYSVHFKKEYEKFIDIFFDSLVYGKLVSLLKNDFQSETSYSIPVLFFETLEEFDGFLQEKNPPHEGGRGNRAFIVVCCKTSYDQVLNRASDTELAERTEQFNVMLHEMTHSILAHGCLTKSNLTGKKSLYPGMAFNEGIAEWAVATVNPGYRSYLFKQNYKKMNTKQFPPDYASMDEQPARKKFGYHPMFWFWFYIEEKYGREKINQYHSEVCSSAPMGDSHLKLKKKEREKFEKDSAERIAKSIFGKDREVLFKEMKSYYKTNQKKYESVYKDWEDENLKRFKKE